MGQRAEQGGLLEGQVVTGRLERAVGPSGKVAQRPELVAVADDTVVAPGDHGDRAVEDDVGVLVDEGVPGAAGKSVLVLLIGCWPTARSSLVRWRSAAP